ncbi:MAG: NADH-quinone oxidoreductase subunit A [Polyangiaceae bacterium]|nr:NADH-quinone oxidoreductase subunit A [Polyangiaceae bacterium]
MQSWIPVLVYLAIASSVGVVMLGAARVLRVRARHVPPTRAATYECGEEPAGKAWIRFHPRYYLVALVFVLFDVETVFLAPWALATRALGGYAVVEMVVFVAVLLLGWVYAWRKGALRWQ